MMGRVLLLLAWILAGAGNLPSAHAQFDSGMMSAAKATGTVVVAAGQSIVSISPTSCTGSAGGACAVISVTMLPPLPSFSGTQTLVSSGGGCTATSVAGSFSGSVFNLNSGLANGTYTFCDQVSETRLATQVFAITATVSSGGGPTPPPQASAAGYTTLAFNTDFTTAAFSNTATFIDVCGASNPYWYNTPYFVQPLPCSDTIIASDSTTGAAQALQANFTYLDAFTQVAMNIGSCAGQDDANCPNPQPSTAGHGGFSYPQPAYYTEVESRLDNSAHDCAGYPPVYTSSCTYGSAYSGDPGPPWGFGFIFDFWSWTTSAIGANAGPIEEDFIENYTYSTTSEATRDWCCGPAFGPGGPSYYSSIGGYNPYNYYVYGARETSNGTNQMAFCTYVGTPANTNGSGTITYTQQSCGTWNPHSGYGDRNGLMFTVGPQTGNNVVAVNPSVPVRVWALYVRQWECATWYQVTTPQQCTGTVLTGPYPN